MSEYNTDELRVSYGIGRQMGTQLRDKPFDGLDIDSVMQGVRDAFEGNPDPINPAHMATAYGNIREVMAAKEAEKGKELAAAGEEFLAENAKRDEVTVTESGLQYEVLQTGEGDKPSAESTVVTHYHGTLIDGTVFDSSYQRGEPATFPVNGVIAGWTEALQLMPVGSKWRLYVPHQLAYGTQGAGGAIAPYATLIFDVELLEIAG